jgi:hyperosmotically inducible protein
MIAQLKAIKGVKDVMDMSKVEATPAPAPVETKSAVDPVVQKKFRMQ